MTDTFPRERPRDTCPHASCGRGNKTCQKLGAGKTCLKTHFATFHDWEEFMISRFNDLTRLRIVLKNPNAEESESLEVIFHALAQRIDDRRAMQDTVH
jgi:hypothetical protein